MLCRPESFCSCSITEALRYSVECAVCRAKRSIPAVSGRVRQSARRKRILMYSCMRLISTSLKLVCLASRSFSATWTSKRFTRKTPKSRCSQSSWSPALNITFTTWGSVKSSFSFQQLLCVAIASIA